MNRKLLLTLVMGLMTAVLANGQANYDYGKLQREKLDRGVVAVRTADGKVAVSWRTLTSDAKGQPYDVYRNGVKLNSEPLTTGGTFFIDEHPLQTDATYECHSYEPSAILALRRLLLVYLAEPLFQQGDALQYDAAVHLQLRLTRAAQSYASLAATAA